MVLLHVSSSSEQLGRSNFSPYFLLNPVHGSRLLIINNNNNNSRPLPFCTAVVITTTRSALRKRRRREATATSFSKQAPRSFYSKPAELSVIATEDQFHEALAQARERSQPIIVNWTATWCRKCIHLKPKLEKLATEYKNVKFYSVDVNKVPQALVNRAEVTKMPTIQLWEGGKKQDEVIGGYQAWLVINEVREMLEKSSR